jgi:ADP-ribosylglycohydrolase
VADEELRENLLAAADALQAGEHASHLAQRLELGEGVGGFINHTVPVALFCALRYGTFREAVERVILLGGDTDTTAAVTGAIAGAAHGPDAIPAEWLRLLELPGPGWAVKVARELALTRLGEAGRVAPSVWLWWLVRLPRNVVFLAAILLHALRRLFPPY